jgi:hypothetical protein
MEAIAMEIRAGRMMPRISARLTLAFSTVTLILCLYLPQLWPTKVIKGSLERVDGHHDHFPADGLEHAPRGGIRRAEGDSRCYLRAIAHRPKTVVVQLQLASLHSKRQLSNHKVWDLLW